MHFSIIIPAKNEEANIGRCLDSIASMDYDRNQYEVIVVDNGSTDGTVSLAKAKGAQVYEKPWLTIAGLRNFGSHQAKGKILAFLDADCTVSPQWLNAAAHYLTCCDVVAFGSPVTIPEQATWVQKTWFQIRGKADRIVQVEWLESANMFVQRQAFFSVNGFNEELITCEDYDLSQKLKAIGKLISDYQVMATHYREPATLSQFFAKERWRGKSNYSGMRNRKIDRHEIPSLLLPLAYLACLTVFSVLICLHFTLASSVSQYAASLLLLWQFPIIFISYLKSKKSLLTILRLFLLFNTYFFARGIAAFDKLRE